MSEQQARRLAALLTERQRRDLLLLARVLKEQTPAEGAAA